MSHRKDGVIEYLERRNRHLLEICRAQSRLVAADFDLDEFMRMSVGLLCSVFGTGGVVVELVDGDEMVYAAIDAGHASYAGTRLSRNASLSGQAAREGRLLHCVDTHDDPRVDRAACEAIGIRSMVCAPLFQNGQVVGVLKAFNLTPGAFGRDDIEAVALVAETLGAALAKQLEHGEREGLLVELGEARRVAEAAARTKAALLANMTHELRTPLTAVLGFSRLIERRADLGEETRVLVQRIQVAGEVLLHTINDILDFSKLEDGHVEIRPRPTALGPCVRETLELLAPQAAEKRLVLELRVDPATPERAMVDPDRVRQLLLNLVGNALKFTTAGTVSVDLFPSADGRGLVFSVADTGAGIAPEGMERLFLRFSQVRGGGHDGGGTGLGLAICKGLVDAMGGTIGAESEPGRGSRFWFCVPLRPDMAGVAPAEEGLASVSGRKVLVADDNPANRVLLRSILQALGAEVAEARDGGEAVDIATGRDFDLILMDLRMPGLDGISAARRIREAAGDHPPPIMAFSADRDVSLEDGLFCGAIPKPIEPEALLAAMAKAIGGGAIGS